MDSKLRPYVICPQEANRDIQKALDNIVDIVKKDVLSEKIWGLFLGGGFGRGEGSVIKKPVGYITSNDFDLFAITDIKIEDEKKRVLERKLEKVLNVKDCSIEVINFGKLMRHIRKGILTQNLFDFMEGNICLWINSKARFDIKLFDRTTKNKYHVPISSAYEVLSIRMWCVCAPFSYTEYNIAIDENYKTREFAYFQLVKAATAIIDAVLIAESIYTSPRFKEKLNIFERSNFSKIVDTETLCKLINNKIYNQNNISILDSNLIEYIVDIYIKAVLYIRRLYKWKYLKYVLFDIIQLIYHKYIKQDKWKGNYSLDIISAITKENRNVKKIKSIQQIMRKNYS